MEEYKQNLCAQFNNKCRSENTIYEYIKEDPRYKCNFNEEGKLHSNYMGSYYEPAIIFTATYSKKLYWLFDGEIKDCNHPFHISIESGELAYVRYYSSERIQVGQPILIFYSDHAIFKKIYNKYCSCISNHSTKVLNEFECGYSDDDSECDDYVFTPEFYPLYNSLNFRAFRFKLAD